MLGLTFSAAGRGALEGARDRLPGFLLSRSWFQRHGADQLTDGRGLRSNKGYDLTHIHDKKNKQSDSKSREWKKTVCECVLLMSAYLLSVCGSKKMFSSILSYTFNGCCFIGFECV